MDTSSARETTPGEEYLSRARRFTLASVLASYPEPDLQAMLEATPDALKQEAGASALLELLACPQGLDDLRSNYLELFDRGKDRASLYETEYGRMRGMSKGNDLADIAGFYQAFGLTIASDETHEMLDHIAVELEFFAFLLLKEHALLASGDVEGQSIVKDARKKFLVEHLGGLASAIPARADVKQHPIYGPIFSACHTLVSDECARLDVKHAALDFYGDEELKREVECGAVHLPVVQ